MAKSNANLHLAKKEKNDEFYTQYSDIEKELVHYKDFFNGKTVYCNCDTMASNFMKFFDDKFDEYGLKKLILTGLKSKGGILYQRTKNSVYVGDLKGDGRFQSDECIEFLKECDVVVTNPPFSLFREYVALLMQYNKKFLIIGNQNAITYKEIFPYIKNNELWSGISMNGSNRWFSAPDDYEVKENAAGYKFENGKKMFFVNGVRWFTNIEHNKRNTPLDLYKRYNAEEYPKYDNYDAIEVSKVCEIPIDYDGVMGVPITFLDKYCPTQFEIIGEANHGKDSEWDLFKPMINGKTIFKRLLIKKL